jgi:class 3 adenylate cyclase/HAMP domain-containing protein
MVQVLLAMGILAFLTGTIILFVFVLDHYVSLFIKQSIVIIPITIAAFAVIYILTFNHMTERLNNEILNELSMAATTSVKLLDGDDIDALTSIKDYQSGAYRRLSATLKDIVGGNKDAWNKSYYAAIYTGKNFDKMLLMSNDESNMFRPFTPLDEESGEYKLFMQGNLAFIGDYSTGTWAISDIPVRNSLGKVVGNYELALDMTNYQVSNLKQRRRITIIVAGIGIGLLLVLILLVSRIVRQLVQVARVLHTISSGDYSARVKYNAKDELGIVTKGVNTMASELQKQFAHIKTMNESTARFVPFQFMEYLGVTDITKLSLGNHVKRNLTVLFFDIRSFSINSEIMSAGDNFQFINKVMGISGPIIRNHNGFIDKYIGDAVMALFVDAADAVRSGIEIYRHLVLSRESRVKIGIDGINIGIGVNSGSAMMGIIGENERLSSTVISKNVNMASRLESLTKQTGSGMLVTRDTLNQISTEEDTFRYRFIGMIQPAGVNEVVGIFDMLDALAPKDRKKRVITKQVFESGITKFHTKQYETACKRFQKVVDYDPDDIWAATCLADAKRRLENPKLPSVFIIDKK